MTAAPPKRTHHIVDRSTANWDENGEYIVGKGRPPRAHQWRKGQSGNPRGPKPREKLTPIQAFEKEVLAEFTAKVNGEEVTINLGTFALQLMKASAAKGTLRSQKELLDLFLSVVRKQVDQDDTPETQAWEQEIIDQVIADYGLPPKPVFRDRDRGGAPTGEPR